MEPIAQVGAFATMLAELVDGLAPGELYRPTNCSGRTVHDVLLELIERGDASAGAFRGDPAPGRGPTLQYGWVPREELRATLDGLDEAMRSSGAAGRTAATEARFVALELLVGGWEVACATGRAFDPPAELVVDVLGPARDALRAGAPGGHRPTDCQARPFPTVSQQ